MNLEAVLERFEQVKRSGHGYTVRCPVHDDRQSSLTIHEEADKILLNCFAGCETKDIIDAVGLTWADLFADGGKVNWAEPEEIYNYYNSAAEVVFQVVRFPSKRFRQRHYNPDDPTADKDGFVWNMDGVQRVLYNLPDVLMAIRSGVTIYVTEGEKDVETLRQIGKVATCNPGGAGKWKDEYSTLLSGAQVVILADRDEPGRKHAESVKTALEGIAQAIWIYQAKTGKDVTDHLAAGHSIEELQPLRPRVRRGIVTSRELAEAGLHDLDAKPTDMPSYEPWISLKGLRLRQGRLYIVGAYTGDGKTSFALQGFRSLSEDGTPCGYHSLEMPERDLRNKLAAHKGVDLYLSENPWELRQNAEKRALYEDAMREIGTWNSDISFDSTGNAQKILEITRDREHEVVFVDHIHRFSWQDRRKLDENVNDLTNMALELNIVVVVLCQLRKYMKGKDMDTYPRPDLQDFRETSMLGDDASMALAIWRERADGLTYTGNTQVVILKNRHTTGAHDRAGSIFFQDFDSHRNLFEPKGQTT